VPNIPGTIFQEPGRDTEQAGTEKPQAAPAPVADSQSAVESHSVVAPAEPTESAEPADAQPDTGSATGSATGQDESAKPKRRRAVARSGPSAFPVHVVKPHPLAFARAQEILEADSSYTKILPGDEPGTIIVR